MILKLVRPAVAFAVILAAFLGAFLASSTLPAGAAEPAPITTIANGPLTMQNVRVDTDGHRIDAHDGHLYFFAGRYYWYGTAYACGFDFNVPGSHYCGVRVYESNDLATWRDDGLALDPTGDQVSWDAHCGGDTYGCYRPKVAYDKATAKYVMWVNESRGDLGGGYLVLTSASPTGPFVLTGHRTMAYNRCPGGALAVFGDEDLFVDEDGTAYLAYTAIFHSFCSPPNPAGLPSHVLAVESLTADYTAGTGHYVVYSQPGTSIESPSLFRRGSTYYLMYSDPSCPYCTTAGTSYATARSPLGTWTRGGNVTPTRLGGQPMSVTPIASNGTTRYLYSVDRWNQVGTSRSITNQYKANYFFAPLSFTAVGGIAPIPGVDRWQAEVEARVADIGLPAAPQAIGTTSGYVPLPSARRVFDSRPTTGPLKHAHGTYTVHLPAALRSAAGITVNVTAVHAMGNGNLRIWGRGRMPATSVINYSSARGVIANLAVVTPDSSGNVHLEVDGADVQVVLDAQGYYAGGAGYRQLGSPQRLLDTRRTGAVPAHTSIDLSLLAGNYVPRTAGWVATNVTVLAPAAGSIAAFDPAAGPAPARGTLTFGAGITAGLHLLHLPADGRIRLTNQTGRALNLLVDVTGYATGDATQILTAPRLLESTAGRVGPYTAPLPAGISHPFSVAAAGVPTTARAVIVRVAAASAATGYVTGFADQGGLPAASVLNFAAHSRPSNLAVVPLSNGMFDLYVHAPQLENVAVWLVGWTR